MWMQGADQPPMESAGTAESEMILGGRFLKCEFEGMLMGMPQEGLLLLGHDNYKQRYSMLLVDNFNTHMLTAVGAMNPETAVEGSSGILRLYGEMDEPMLDMHDRMVRYEVDLTTLAEGRWTLRVYDLDVGPDARVVESEFKRAE
jgi:hypothetical protein